MKDFDRIRQLEAERDFYKKQYLALCEDVTSYTFNIVAEAEKIEKQCVAKQFESEAT